MLLLKLLGGVSIEGPNGVVSGKATQRHPLALLVLLALSHSRRSSRDKLVAYLWPERGSTHARNRLNQSVHVLRQALCREAILSEADELVLNPEVVSCDVWGFEEALAAGDAERGVGLYVGPLLDGFFLADSPEFERWTDGERERLHQAYIRALEELAEAATRSGDRRGAVEWWRRLAGEEPHNSNVTLRFMQALEASGDRAGAIREAEAHAELLREEFGAAPSPAVLDLAERIRTRPRGPRQAPPVSEPRPGLAKVPADRAPTAEEFADAVQTAGPGAGEAHPAVVASEPGAPRRSGVRRLPRTALVRAGLTLLIVLGVAGLYGVVRSRDRASAPSEMWVEGAEPAIAVLPFTVRGEGQEIWREGLVDALTTNLLGVEGMRAIASRTILARWNEGASADGPIDLATALSVAQRTGARYAVVGSMIASGEDVRLLANLYDTDSREILDQVTAEGSGEDILRLIDELSLEIVRSIGSGVATGLPKLDLANVTTASPEALKAYLEGEAHFRAAEYESAIEAYGDAVALDSSFVLAHYRLANAHGWADNFERVNEALARAEQALEQAKREGRWVPSREQLAVTAELAYLKNSPDAFSLAKRAVREHPRDARLWHILGDIYAHRGARLLAPPGSEREAFARAIEADSSLLRPYTHLINSTFRLDPDSDHIADLIDRYEAWGAPAGEVAFHRTAFTIAFGDSAARTTAYAALDTFSTTPGGLGRWFLSHPRFLVQRAEVFRIASRLELELEPWFSDWLVVRTALDRGRIREALDELNARDLRPGLRLPTLYRPYTQGLPIPKDVLDSNLRIELPDTVLTDPPVGDAATQIPIFYTTAYAISEGAPDAAANAAGRLWRAARYHREGGDTIRARIADGAAQALLAFHAWKNGGDVDEARRLLQEVQADHFYDEWRANRTVRWWLGELLVESGQLREAVPYYVSLVEGATTGLYDPPAAYRLGQVYELLGEVEKARDAYEYFLLAWRDADPELQPQVEAARRAIENLSTDG